MITIDSSAGIVTIDGKTLNMNSAEAFAVLSDVWMDLAIRVKHPYTFTWMGRPVVQLADDLLRLQEILFTVQPDVIVECGIAHGGSLIFHASLCKALGRGRVIGIDVEIRPHNRAAIEAHLLMPLITLIEGSSIDPAVVASVAAAIRPDETVLVVLDSNHTREHVLAELEAYTPLIKPGSYAVAMDGYIMQVVTGGPQAAIDWPTNNPNTAVEEFAATHPEFVRGDLPFLFNESVLTHSMTGFRGGVLKRIR